VPVSHYFVVWYYNTKLSLRWAAWEEERRRTLSHIDDVVNPSWVFWFISSINNRSATTYSCCSSPSSVNLIEEGPLIPRSEHLNLKSDAHREWSSYFLKIPGKSRDVQLWRSSPMELLINRSVRLDCVRMRVGNWWHWIQVHLINIFENLSWCKCIVSASWRSSDDWEDVLNAIEPKWIDPDG